MIVRYVLFLMILLGSVAAAVSSSQTTAGINTIAELERVEREQQGQGCNTKSVGNHQNSDAIHNANRAGVHPNIAFFDIYPSHLAPSFGYIAYDMNGSFDLDTFLRRVGSVHERNIKVFIKARIMVPKSIKTDEVYLYGGEDYRYKGLDGERFIVYNDDLKTQYERTPLLDIKKDINGKRYVSFLITLFIYTPYKISTSSKLVPNYHFAVAPKVKGFEKKFLKANIYIVEK